MSEHHARIGWKRTTPDFAYDTYNREHEWRFKGGNVVAASAAPAFKGRDDRVDPEDAFVATLSSCHMLTFLAIAARKRLAVDFYEDDADGHLEKNADGKLAMTRVTLRPRVRFAEGVVVDAATLDRMHHQAHEQCFIANSVKTDVRVEPAA